MATRVTSSWSFRGPCWASCWKRCFLTLLLAATARVAQSVDVFEEPRKGDSQEAFGRRSCKFRPLPTDLAEGYGTPEGGFQVAETFGAPLAVLVGAGHRMVAKVSDARGALMGFTVQVPFHGNAQVVVEATVGQRTLKCTHTWGAGGHMKQCGLSRIQLPMGPVTFTFRATGLGGGLQGAAACLSLRLDLEISSQEASESARRCFQSAFPAAAPPLLSVGGSGDASIPWATFSSPAPNGVIWKAALPAAQANSFNRLFARVTFPSMVHPVRLLIEELQPWAAIGEEPKCSKRCFTGTATAHGQVLQRLLPPAMPFALWILSDDHDGSGITGGHCANYDFELSMGPLSLSSMGQVFLGPPTWLCEGSAWPRRLEQSDGIATSDSEQVLRQRRFALRDHFDLTRPPETGATSSLGGLHAMEIQVSEPSIFRLTTHAPTVPARPVLVPGRQDEAWLALANPKHEIVTRRIPAAGREFRHSISTELSPGEYTLLFVSEMPTGGLKPCASLMLNLLLEPLASGVQSTCASDAGNGILDLQAMAEPLPITAWHPTSNSFTVTLPRPPGSFEEGAGDAEGLQIIARSSMNLGLNAADAAAPPVMLHAKVTSPFSTADLQVTFYENGQPLGEPIPLPDGNGYTAMAGPVMKDAFYEVVLFHVPRLPSSRSHCVEFDVELGAISLTPPTANGQFIAPLPGAENCWSAPELPKVIRVREGEATVLEGNFQLPPEEGHAIRFIASSAVLLRVSVSSRDAEVRLGQDEPLNFLALAEDRHFHRGPAGTLTVRARPNGLSNNLCPLVRMHLVVLQETAAPECRSGDSLEALGATLRNGLVEQFTDNAQLKPVAAKLLPTAQQATTVPFSVTSVAVEFRLELGLEAPWLPLEVKLLREGQENAWATARFAGQRLVMLLPSLPRGSYQLQLSFWGTATRCVSLLGTVALLAPKGRDTSNYRQEMLDLPELLSARVPPATLVPGWWRAERELLSSEIYTIPAGGSISSQLQLQSPCIFRLVAEPTDILVPRLSVELKQGGASISSSTATGSGLVLQLAAGTYTVVFTSTDQAIVDLVPFFVTWSLAPAVDSTENRAQCEGTRMEDAAMGGSQASSSWEFKKQLNLAALPSGFKLPIAVPQPAVATIASWSSFSQHYVRVALVSDEGLWVGEQRGRRSALEIELPPGDYQMMLEEMAPLSPAPAGCMTLGVAVSLVPFSAIEKSNSAGGLAPPFLGASLGLGARCDGLGALPLPLDAVSATGGSAAYGGPVDIEGRLLIRERVMLTDIHDGRKKVYLRLPASSVLRVAVVSEDAMETEVVLEDGEHQQIAAAESRIMGEGQAASYVIESTASLWISFHREHRVAQSAGCASFDLLLQSAPKQDMLKMSSCGSYPRDLQQLVEKALERFHESSVSGAEARVSFGSGATASVHLRLQQAALVQVEVQFNFLLSNVHLSLDGAAGGVAVPPHVAPHGAATAEKNARATLRLRLEAGDHIVRIRHDPAFPAEGSRTPCAPLGLRLRRLTYTHGATHRRPVVSMPMAPLVSGSDLVVHLDSAATSANLAQKAPSAASLGARGGYVMAWSASALLGVLGESGRLVSPSVDGSSRIWALPLHVENGGGDGELWFALDRKSTGRPWSGDATAAAGSSPVALWPVDEAPVALEPGAAVPAAAAITMLSAPLPPAASAASAASVDRGGGLVSMRLLCWAALLGVVACYVQRIQPAWFLHLKYKWQSIFEMAHGHGIHSIERDPHFGHFEAASEMTNPWAWPTTIPARNTMPQARSTTRMYGTLDL